MATMPKKRARAQDVDQGASARTAELLRLRAYGRTFFGSNAAMKVEVDLLAGEDVGPWRYTLQMEFARANPDRTYAWDRKAAFQLTQDEVPLVGAFLMRCAGAALEIGNHGPDRNKKLLLKWQEGGKLYVRFSQGGAAAALPLEPQHAHAWRVLLLQAMKLNAPEVESSAQIELLRLMHLDITKPD